MMRTEGLEGAALMAGEWRWCLTRAERGLLELAYGVTLEKTRSRVKHPIAATSERRAPSAVAAQRGLSGMEVNTATITQSPLSLTPCQSTALSPAVSHRPPPPPILLRGLNVRQPQAMVSSFALASQTVPLVIPPTSPILADPNTIILDASWLYEPDPPTRNALDEFNAKRFPRARFWSLDDVSEPHPQGYVLMLPTPERFAAFAGAHGISKDSHVVVYDSDGVFSAPRTVFTFKVWGE